MSYYTKVIVVCDRAEDAQRMCGPLNEWADSRYVDRFETAPGSPCLWARLNHFNCDEFRKYMEEEEWHYDPDLPRVLLKFEGVDRYLDLRDVSEWVPSVERSVPHA